MAGVQGALGMRCAVLADIGSLFDAGRAGRFVASTARLDLAATVDASDLGNVGNSRAVTARRLLALVANATTARVESGEDIDALEATHAGEDGAALHAFAAASVGGGEDGLGTAGRLRTARLGTGVRGRTSRARRAVVTVREGVARAGFAALPVVFGNATAWARSAGLGTGVGDGTSGAVGAHVVVRVGSGRAVLAASVGVDLAVGALVNALVGGGRASAASLAGGALGAGAGASGGVGVFRAVRARGGTGAGEPTSRAGLAPAVVKELTGTALTRALGGTREGGGAVRASLARRRATGREGVGRALGAGRGVGAAIGASSAGSAATVRRILSGGAVDRRARSRASTARGSRGAVGARASAVGVGEGTRRAGRARGGARVRVGTSGAGTAGTVVHVAACLAFGSA